MRRLEADWRAAVRASGNPYKRDYKKGDTQTALGDLVQVYRSERHAVARPEVFDGLSSQRLEKSWELPYYGEGYLINHLDHGALARYAGQAGDAPRSGVLS